MGPMGPMGQMGQMGQMGLKHEVIDGQATVHSSSRSPVTNEPSTRIPCATMIEGLANVDGSGQELAGAAARGDLKAFELWCTRLERPLYGYAFGMVRNVHDAEDIVQETLLRMYRLARERRLRDDAGSARSLAFGIAHNLAVDTFRRRRGAQPVSEARSPEAYQSAEASLVREQVERAVAELPEKQRSAWMLRTYGELSYAEIAVVLGISLEDVKVGIHRARKRLATLLDRDGQYVGERSHGM
ncbi:MAG: RNA polymerase sigma factor [Candidatus Hydrogenedentes bacterium]|nr:RNA polymerase sigma factor [Candidatus Hydrogenedentota bacterium]